MGDSDRFGALVAEPYASGVGRVVFVSSGGAERRTGAGHIDGLARIEAHLDATGADVCHLRCGYFYTNLLMDTDALASGVLTTAADPDAARPWVDPRDIGDVAAARLLSEAWSGRVVQGVHGPEDLSWHQVAEIVTDAVGHAVRVQAVADDDVRAALQAAGLPHGAVEGIVGMTAGTRDLTPEQPPATCSPPPHDAGCLGVRPPGAAAGRVDGMRTKVRRARRRCPAAACRRRAAR